MIRPALTGAVALGAICIHLADGHALQAPGKLAPAGALRVQRAEIMDRKGFEKPLVALTLLVPAGWRAEGAVEYAPLNSCGPAHWINWHATAADNSGAIQIVSEEKWSAGNFPQPAGCLSAPISAARPYLEWWVQRNRPGARVLDFRPRPDLVQPYQALNSNSANNGTDMRSWVDGGELLIAYEVNGRPVREAISTVAVFTKTRFPSLDPSQAIELLQGETFFGFAMRAPEGALDFKRAEALRQSIRLGAEWNGRMIQASNERFRIASEANRQMAQTNLQAAAERSAIIAKTAGEINDIQMGTWRSQNESQDRTQRERVEAIRGVETYNDPHFGGTVQLSNQYQHAWQLKDGSYLLTDDVNFDPSRDLGVQGQRLTPAQ